MQEAAQHPTITGGGQLRPRELIPLPQFAGFAHIAIVRPVIGGRLVADDQPHQVQIDDDPPGTNLPQPPLPIRGQDRVQLPFQRRDRLGRRLAQQRVEPPPPSGRLPPPPPPPPPHSPPP